MTHLSVRRLLVLAAAAGLLVAGGADQVFAQAAPPSVAGKWLMTFETDQGVMTASLVLEQQGEAVTGRFSGLHDMDLGVRGEWTAAQLAFEASGDAHGQTVSINFVCTLEKDGTLKGRLTSEMGAMPWTAARQKGPF